MITLTDLAATEVKRLLEHEGREDWGLRIGVKGGGCSGLEYTMVFEQEQKEKDKVFEDKGVKFFVDQKSLLYLQGMTLDYSKELIGGGFRFVNPNAQRSCSCGQSFTA